jgi:antitoxin component HigA of HigAB toxin-antitoxin module
VSVTPPPSPYIPQSPEARVWGTMDEIQDIIRATIRETQKKRRNDRGNGSPQLGQVLRDHMRDVGVTAQQFANNIGRDVSLIHKVERGDRGMSVETLARIMHNYPMTTPRYIKRYLEAIYQTDEASR